MTGETHLKTGFYMAMAAAAGIPVMYGSFTKANLLLGIGIGLGVIGGSMCPDIDDPDSLINNSFQEDEPIYMEIPHRKYTHVPLAAIASVIPFALLTLLAYRCDWNEPLRMLIIGFGIGTVVGWFKHLIEDTFTPAGIMWLWPISSRYFSLYRSKRPKNEGEYMLPNEKVYSVICGIIGLAAVGYLFFRLGFFAKGGFK